MENKLVRIMLIYMGVVLVLAMVALRAAYVVSVGGQEAAVISEVESNITEASVELEDIFVELDLDMNYEECLVWLESNEFEGVIYEKDNEIRVRENDEIENFIKIVFEENSDIEGVTFIKQYTAVSDGEEYTYRLDAFNDRCTIQVPEYKYDRVLYEAENRETLVDFMNEDAQRR